MNNEQDTSKMIDDVIENIKSNHDTGKVLSSNETREAIDVIYNLSTLNKLGFKKVVTEVLNLYS